MKRRVKVSEEQVQKLGSETPIRAHFSDELRVNELFAFGEQAEEPPTAGPRRRPPPSGAQSSRSAPAC